MEMRKRGGEGVVKYLGVTLTILGVQLDSSHSSQHDLLKWII